MRLWAETHTCAGCRFYAPFDSNSGGNCRRHAPRLVDAAGTSVAREGKAVMTAFPFTFSDRYCGEWQTMYDFGGE